MVFKFNGSIAEISKKMGEAKAQEILARALPIFKEMIMEKEMQVLQEGMKPGGWFFDMAYNAMYQSLKSAVYDVYEPKTYMRRYTSIGGLACYYSLELSFDMDRSMICGANVAEYNSTVQLSTPLADFIAFGATPPNPRDFYPLIAKHYNIDGVTEKLYSLVFADANKMFSEALERAL